jgi:hypothetical protein
LTGAAIGTSLGRGETDFTTPRLADKTLLPVLNGRPSPIGVRYLSKSCRRRDRVDSRDAAAADWNRRPTIPVILAAE